MNEIIEQTQSISRAELDIQISTAKQYPRDSKRALIEMIEQATATQEIAESCYYFLPRKDKKIEGPSVRLAEIALSCWGNTHVGKRVVGNDGKKVSAEAVCWDLERNVKINEIVDRSICGKDGRTYTHDMQIVTGNAAKSIALRNAIFSVIPKSIIEEVYRACRKAAVGEAGVFLRRRKATFDRLNELGIPERLILEFFNKNSTDEFDKENLADLIGVGTAIKEGLLKASDAFAVTDDMLPMDIKSRIEFAMLSKKQIGE